MLLVGIVWDLKVELFGFSLFRVVLLLIISDVLVYLIFVRVIEGIL